MTKHILLAISLLLVPILADAAPEPVELEVIQALWDGGARDSALVLIDTELQRARAESDSSRLAKLLLKEGRYHAAFSDYGHCEGVLKESMALAEALADSTTLIAALRWFGVSVGSLGRNEEAVELYARLLSLARILGDRPHEGWAHVGLGWHAWRQGDSDGAAIDYREAIELFSGTEDMRGEIWARNGLAGILTSKGEYESALECYRGSLLRAEASGAFMAEASALNDIGSMEFYLGLTDRALEHFRRSVSIHTEHGNLRRQIRPLFNIASCLNILGRTEEARETLIGARAIGTEQGYADLEALALVKLGEILMNQGHMNEAGERFREALEAGQVLRLDSRITARIGLASVLKQQGLIEAALKELEAAEELLASTSLTWQQMRIEGKQGQILALLGSHREAIDKLLDLAARADEHGVVEFRFQALAEAANSYQALALPDSALFLYEQAANIWESQRRLLLDPDWREQRGSTGKMIFTDLAFLMIAQGKAAEAFDRIQAFKGRTLAERMLGPGSRHDSYLAAESSSVTLADLQQEILLDDELLLDFYLGPKHSLLFALTRNELKVKELAPADSLEKRLRSYAELLSSPAAASPGVLNEVGGRLARALFGEDLEILGDHRHILASPDGALNLLPFAELPGCGDRSWTRIPSSSILRRLREQVASRSTDGPWRILAIASGTGVAGETLPGALRELGFLERNYRGVTAIRLPDEGRDFGPHDLAGHDLLHLAAHAKRDDQNPWQSSIQFLPDEEGGELRAAEITELQLDASLAILSSCGSGGGGILSGEGVLGLSSAFLVAGVPSVLATLWAVDDAATAYFVKFFYQALARGETCAQALLSAQSDLKSHPETEHPYYWAGFVIIGEGDLKPELSRKPGMLLPASGFAVLMIVIFASRRRAGKA